MFMLDVYLRGHFGERYSAVLFLKNCFVLNDEDRFTAADKELMKRTEQEVGKMMAEDDEWDEFQHQASKRRCVSAPSSDDDEEGTTQKKFGKKLRKEFANK